MSEMTVIVKLVGTTKNNHKLQVDSDASGGAVGALYLPKALPLPDKVNIIIKP